MTFDAVCPNCGTSEAIPPERAGTFTSCPRCGTAFVPSATTSQPPQPPPQPQAYAHAPYPAQPAYYAQPHGYAPPGYAPPAYAPHEYAPGYGHGYAPAYGYQPHPQPVAHHGWWGWSWMPWQPPSTDNCTACGAPADARDQYCFECGERLPIGSTAHHHTRWRLFHKHAELQGLEGNLKTARNSILIVACIVAVITMLAGAVMSIATPYAAEANAVTASMFVNTALFFGLWIWARWRPLPATVATALILITVCAQFIGNALATGNAGAAVIVIGVAVTVPAVVLWLVLRGVKAAVNYTRARRELLALHDRLSEQR